MEGGLGYRAEHRRAAPVLRSTPGPHMQDNTQLPSSISSTAAIPSSQSLLCSLSGLAVPITLHFKVQTGNLFSLDSHITGFCPGIESWFLSLLSSPCPAPHKILAPCLEPISEAAALSFASPGMGPLAFLLSGLESQAERTT